MSRQRILIVDDEQLILKILRHALGKEGYDIATAADGAEAVAKALSLRPDLIILDIMLPTFDGFEVCQKIKAQADIPIIILSAKGDEVDKIIGFKMGADDYQTKPFSPSELVLRVKAVLRRSKGADKSSASGHNGPSLLSFKELKVNRSERTVTVRGHKAELTAKEFDLLWYLASHPSQVFTRMQLLEQVWDSTFPGDENTVTVHIRRLREKIEENPARPRFVVTVWGVGYKFDGGN